MEILLVAAGMFWVFGVLVTWGLLIAGNVDEWFKYFVAIFVWPVALGIFIGSFAE